MINNKNFYLILITYLTIVCSFYHIIYWFPFGLNGLSLINLEDIIKSALGILTLSIISSLLGVFVAYLLFKKHIDKKENKNINIWLYLKDFLFFSMLTMLLICFYESVDKITVILLILSIFIANRINSDFIFDKQFELKINKTFLILILLIIPAISIGTAFSNYLKIYNNIEFMFSIIQKNKIKTINNELTYNKEIIHSYKDTLKFLGKSEDFFIFTDLNNSEIFFIKSDTIKLKRK